MAASGVLYEVNIDLHPDIAEAYKEWLRDHAGRMFGLIEGLRAADLYMRPDPVPCPADYDEDDGGDGGEGMDKPRPWVGITATYRVGTQAALDDYLTHRASAMRAEAVERFGTKKFRASRRILTSFASLLPPGGPNEYVAGGELPVGGSG